MSNKEVFLKYCKEFYKELEDLQNRIDLSDEVGTLAYIGANFSYDLAIIGFKLGYASWCFQISGDFQKVKNDFINTIMYNEKLDDLRTVGELKNIEQELLRAEENNKE